MNELSSSEFRKVFAGLREVTAVTVHGHLIGTYVPATAEDGLAAEVAHLKRELARRPSIEPYPGPVETNTTYPGPLVDTTVRYDPGTRRSRQAVIGEGSIGSIAAVQRAAKERVMTSPAARRERQSVIDQALGKVNRKTKGA